jgi:transcription elongation factor Elf1
MPTRSIRLGAFQRDEDWQGNNAAFTCPLPDCGKVYIVSALIDKKGRKCPACGLSKALISAAQSKGGKAWIEWPATLEPHRYIVRVRTEPSEDHPGESVTIVTTNLNVNRENPNYDAAAMAELTEQVEAWQAEHVRMVTIEGPV